MPHIEPFEGGVVRRINLDLGFKDEGGIRHIAGQPLRREAGRYLRPVDRGRDQFEHFSVQEKGLGRGLGIGAKGDATSYAGLIWIKGKVQRHAVHMPTERGVVFEVDGLGGSVTHGMAPETG